MQIKIFSCVPLFMIFFSFKLSIAADKNSKVHSWENCEWIPYLGVGKDKDEGDEKERRKNIAELLEDSKKSHGHYQKIKYFALQDEKTQDTMLHNLTKELISTAKKFLEEKESEPILLSPKK